MPEALPAFFAAIPEVAAAAAPEVAVGADVAGALAAPTAAGLSDAAIAGLAASPGAGAFASTALPELLVTPEAAAAAAAPAAEAGLSGADVAAGLGAGSLLGITPALAGGLSPASRVSGEFAALPGGGAGPALPIGAVPGFGPGGAPLPTPAPAAAKLPGVASVGGSGAGGAQASGHDLSGSSTEADTTDTALAGLEGTNLSSGGPGVAGAPTNLAPPSTIQTPGTGGIGGFFKNNAGLLTLLGAGLGGELLAPTIANKLGLTNVPQQGNLTNIANQAAGVAGQQTQTGQTLEQPLVTGVLPPDQQAQIDQGLNSAIGAIKGKYASLGLSGSTMEQSAINDATQNAQVIKGQIEQQMFQSGSTAISEALSNMNLQEQVYSTLLNAQVAQDDQLQQSIGQFASALALGSAISSSKAA